MTRTRLSRILIHFSTLLAQRRRIGDLEARGNELAATASRILALSMLLIGTSAINATASADAPDQPGETSAGNLDGASGVVQVAQANEVRTYVDQEGRRIILDPFTTSVLGVERLEDLDGGGVIKDHPLPPDAAQPEMPAAF